MAASSSATLFGLKEEALKNFHHEQLEHSSAEGATPVVASSTPSGAASQRRKRNHPGNPSKIFYTCVCGYVIPFFF